jgi:hypothetical protein
MPPRTRKTARKHTGPIGVPRHQLAPREQDSSSGSNDPIGDLEARANQLQAELQRRTNLWVADGDQINELRSYMHFWFAASLATLCLTFLPKVSSSIRTTNLRQSVAHLATNQTSPTSTPCKINLLIEIWRLIGRYNLAQ